MDTTQDRSPRRPANPCPAAARIADWIRPTTIVLDADIRDRRHAIEIAAAAIARAHGLAGVPVFDALWRREQSGSTALGESFAIPHARIGSVVHPVTAFVRSTRPIAFDTADGRAVSNLLVILVPADGANDDHLRLLAIVARLISTRRFRKHLQASRTEDEVAEAFRIGIDRAVDASA